MRVLLFLLGFGVILASSRVYPKSERRIPKTKLVKVLRRSSSDENPTVDKLNEAVEDQTASSVPPLYPQIQRPRTLHTHRRKHNPHHTIPIVTGSR